MQPKKNPKADLAKSSGLFFAIGFALVSGLSLFAFEYTREDKGPDKVTLSDADKNLDEEQEQFVMEHPGVVGFGKIKLKIVLSKIMSLEQALF